MDPEERSKVAFIAEKAKRSSELSEKVKKFQEDLLRKEHTHPEFVPQKRRFREEGSELPEAPQGGIKLQWREKKVFSEEILHKIFEEYGEIIKILSFPSKAYMIFSNTMACVLYI